ncbi:uncharacterized protein LY79DRAFT_358092 [Colletotrichum navitas]|uniref:Uncharacterized protein n=1 Tax=Colletotrichum navitas TaxID=681940 RepID=A0AAD8PSB4_9PEZI|nr:uncharacterized protein LY79DRAFT_358092 [Colletotrichum navitas]KAK1579179.1 hypothetical protein LY79DRAFT_358092 [Colletotrichum navitas]
MTDNDVRRSSTVLLSLPGRSVVQNKRKNKEKKSLQPTRWYLHSIPVYRTLPPTPRHDPEKEGLRSQGPKIARGTYPLSTPVRRSTPTTHTYSRVPTSPPTAVTSHTSLPLSFLLVFFFSFSQVLAPSFSGGPCSLLPSFLPPLPLVFSFFFGPCPFPPHAILLPT